MSKQTIKQAHDRRDRGSLRLSHLAHAQAHAAPHVPRSPSAAASRAWRIHFFQRHSHDDPARTVPGREFLLACPDDVRATMLAVLGAVATAPPPLFAGGGMWEAMDESMTGFYEIRVSPDARSRRARRATYRLYCLLEHDDGKHGLGGPSVIIVGGKATPLRAQLAPRDHEDVRALRAEYLFRRPRTVAT